MRIVGDQGEIAMKGDVVREADQEVGVDPLGQEDVTRNVEEGRAVEIADVEKAGTGIDGEVRNVEDNIAVRGGLKLISDLSGTTCWE
jgi:hypothetical protein